MGVGLETGQCGERRFPTALMKNQGSLFKSFIETAFILFPFQSNTNRLSDLTVHCLVKGERGSTLTGFLSFDMQVKNNREKGSFSPCFACQSLTPVTGEKCSLLDQVIWEDLRVQTSSQPLGNMYQVFYQSLWPGDKIRLLNHTNQVTSSFISHYQVSCSSLQSLPLQINVSVSIPVKRIEE